MPFAQRLSHIALVISFGFLFSGCNVQSLFSQLTRTQEERGAAEAIKNAQLQNKRLEELKIQAQKYNYSVQLMPIKTDASGLIFVSMSTKNNQSEYHIQGYTSPSENGEYHVWLTNDQQDRFIDLGAVVFDSEGKFNLSQSIDGTDLGLTSVIYSLDASDSARPLDPQLAGKLVKNP